MLHLITRPYRNPMTHFPQGCHTMATTLPPDPPTMHHIITKWPNLRYHVLLESVIIFHLFPKGALRLAGKVIYGRARILVRPIIIC